MLQSNCSYYAWNKLVAEIKLRKRQQQIEEHLLILIYMYDVINTDVIYRN